jgi:5'-nucleotidase
MLLFAQGTTITVLHVSDTHSHLDAFGPKKADLSGTVGGIAKAATVVGMTRAAHPNVLLLHAGDIFQGDPIFNTYFGVPELQLMAQIGFDAMTVGNHEFSYGPGPFSDVVGMAFAGGSFPLLSANLDLSAYPPLQPYIRSSIVKQFDGVKVGIFGLTTPYDPTTMPAPAVIMENVFEIAAMQMQALRDSGASVVICLSHLGNYLDRILAANVPGIDYIIGGHDHYTYEQPVAVTNPLGGTTYVFQAGAHYEAMGELTFNVDGPAVTMVGYRLIKLDAAIPAEPSTQAAVDMIKQGVVAKFGDIYHTVLGKARWELPELFDPASRLRDTPMGNLVTDAFRWKTHTKIAVTALGLISEKISAGKIVAADVFRALSYGYDPETGLGLNIATCNITGAELIKGLEIGLSQLEVSEDFFLQVSGMSFVYDSKRPVGQRVLVHRVRIGGCPLKLNKSYSMTVNTGIVMLLTELGVNVTGIQFRPEFEYTVVKDFIAHLGTVKYRPEGRIKDRGIYCKEFDPDMEEPGVVENSGFRLLANYPNPFNPTTIISYELPVAGYVTLKIYNTLGQEVATLFEGVSDAGSYQREWDASGMPSGLYFYRLQSASFTETRRMMFVK